MPHIKSLKGRIYVEGRRGGTAWVPYKTLIGYGVGNRVIIGSRGEQMYTTEEYRSPEAAVEAAKARANAIIHGRFGEAKDIRWDVIEEGVPAFVNG